MIALPFRGSRFTHSLGGDFGSASFVLSRDQGSHRHSASFHRGGCSPKKLMPDATVAQVGRRFVCKPMPLALSRSAGLRDHECRLDRGPGSDLARHDGHRPEWAVAMDLMPNNPCDRIGSGRRGGPCGTSESCRIATRRRRWRANVRNPIEAAVRGPRNRSTVDVGSCKTGRPMVGRRAGAEA